MKKFISIICFIVQLVPFRIMAQSEQLFPLGSNPVIKQFQLQHGQAGILRSSVNLDLPFIDDFSSTQVYPDLSLWLDRNVYVNNHFARNMLTIGVATFDGLDENGDPYNNTAGSIQGGCDTLTSRPINLLTAPSGGQYQLSDSLTVSFLYQKKGWGDAPDFVDSLVLDFYNPTSNQWSRQWFAKGGISSGQDTVFIAAEVRVRNAAFLKDGFQFRFRTYGSKTGSLDHWHLDYIRMYKAFNSSTSQLDTAWTDVAMTQPCRSYLDGYTSVPWSHFMSLSSQAQGDLILDNATMNYLITAPQPADVGFNNRIYDYQGNITGSFGATNGNIFLARPNNQNLDYSYPVSNSVFPASSAINSDSALFVIKDFFSNGNANPGLKSNDTVTYTQEFYNYYSYDDGTAEGGYDLIGTNTGKLAMKFDLLKPDTLRAIRFFFTQYGDSVNNYLFTIKIWSSLSPETVLYQEINQRAAYIDSLNGYATYVLDQLIPVSGTIYIGFQQQQNFPNGIHLGFDKNIASNSRMFYNTGSGWTQTTVANGTFMIRPVFGDSTLFTGINPVQVTSSEMQVYPNPASSFVNLKIPQYSSAVSIEVYSLTGQLIIKQRFSERVDISELNPSTYLIRVVYNDGRSMSKMLNIQR